MASLMPPYQLEGKGVRGRCGPPHSIRPLGVQQPGARFFAAAALPRRTTTRRASCGHTPGGPRQATPTRPLPFPCRSGQWRSYEWHDLPELGSLQLCCAWKPGKTLLEGEAGRGCWRLWGDGFRTPSNHPLCLDSADHSSANWLGDVAGCHFPVGLCGTLLPGD
uniref:Uncharacterized protein n=1 Tax=Rhinopithecus bieti TaxID=61621 RepID=A0A2K6L3X5_RHIBE